ncbi:hypothetical protein HDU82_005498 [Entophlyctis luteolus]|nr:hypothetical protein HDU82_005498 [Entophlyctis luteolus]
MTSSSSDTTPLLASPCSNGSGPHYQRASIDDIQEETFVSVRGFTMQSCRLQIYALLSLLSLGAVPLVAHWFPQWRLLVAAVKSPLESSDVVCIEDDFGEVVVAEIKKHPISHATLGDIFPYSSTHDLNDSIDEIVYFEYKRIRFILNPSSRVFETILNWRDFSWGRTADMGGGVTDLQAVKRLIIFGPNRIIIGPSNWMDIFLEEVLSPLSFFQILCIIQWFSDEYASCGWFILFTIVFSIASSFYENSEKAKLLESMCEYCGVVRVRRSGHWRYIPVEHLVPGDVIEVDPAYNSVMPCDAVLIEGSCIMNESMLTGESKFISKSEISQEELLTLDFNEADPSNSRHVSRYFLFYGTKVVKSKGSDLNGFHDSKPASNALALVVRTGVNTTKVMCFDKTGTLTHEGLEILGFRWAMPASAASSEFCKFSSVLCTPEEVLQLNRPREDNSSEVYEHPRILTAMASCHAIQVLDGELIGDPVDLKMFEWTGWEIGNDFGLSGSTISDQQGFTSIVVRPPGHSGFQDALRESVGMPTPPSLSPKKQLELHENFTEIGVLRSFEFVSKLRRMSVVTRTLTVSRSGVSGSLDSPGLRSSKEFHAYCKGAPEVILSLCNSSSVPSDYLNLLRRYAHHGYHVIALAYKAMPNTSWLKLMRMKRSDVESNLQFLGFLVFENKLKPETEEVVSTLHSAKIRQVMCTGDNILTAVSVARESGIMSSSCRIFAPHFVDSERGPGATIVWEDVDQNDHSRSGINMQLELDPVTLKPVIAIKSAVIADPNDIDFIAPERFVEVEIKEDYQIAVTGDVFSWMLEHTDKFSSFYRLLLKAQVFARMSPEQKTLLVKHLKELGYCVGFCGDGANGKNVFSRWSIMHLEDWGALQAADVGVSLSPVEVSVAAPFTSTGGSISCIVALIREGRASLVTSFGICKYLMVNGLIQYASVMLLYSIYTNLGDNMFPFIDLALTVPIAVFMSESGPNDQLHPKQPTSSLMSKKVMFSIVGQSCIQAAMQLAVFFGIRLMPFYSSPNVDVAEENLRCYENTAVFLLSNFQYLIVALVYCDGEPYRENISRNKRFVVAYGLLLTASLYLTLSPSEYVLEVMDLATLPIQGRLFILLIAAANLLVTSAAEAWVIPLAARVTSWMSIEYASLEEPSVCDGGENGWSHAIDGDRSARVHRRERALKEKWMRKGKIYRVVEMDMDN